MVNLQEQLIKDIAYAYKVTDEAALLALSGMPDEWLKSLYPDIDMIKKYGAGYRAVAALWKQMSEKHMETWRLTQFLKSPAGLNLREEDSLYYESESRISVFGADMTPYAPAYLEMMKLTEVAKLYSVAPNLMGNAMLALQFRHLAKEDSSFTMDDYDRLTAFLRTQWGQVHPEDDSLGLI